MPIDYSAIAADYDLSRAINTDTIRRFDGEVSLAGKTVFDFGCGTGNYALAIKKLFGADVYGADPSAEMREKAREKGVDARWGDHASLPFLSNFFDFAYMTDVVHHVPDAGAMFSELYRVLKPGGRLCVVTESHAQLGTRFWAEYFPASVEIERKRYPDIPALVSAAEEAGLECYKTEVTDEERDFAIKEDFVKLVENKGYSIFRLMSERDYKSGIETLRKDFEGGRTIKNSHGETLLWLRKGM